MKNNNLPSTDKTFTQKDIPGMLANVEKAIAGLKSGVPAETSTTKALEGFGKIKDIDSVSELIKAHSSVVNRHEAYHRSAKVLLGGSSIKTPPFKVSGHTMEQWVADISKRVVEVGHKVEIEKLNKIKAKLESNLSAKAKLAADLLAINELLND